MSTFIELVILPALFPWLITLVTGWVEDRLDRRSGLATQGGDDPCNERSTTRKACMVLDIPAQAGVAAGCRQD